MTTPTKPALLTDARPNGTYHVESIGAGAMGLYFLPKRCRKARYIATVTSLETARRCIEQHVTTGCAYLGPKLG